MVGTVEEIVCFFLLPSDLVAVDEDEDDDSSSDDEDICNNIAQLSPFILQLDEESPTPPAAAPPCLAGMAKASAWSKLKLRRRTAVTQRRPKELDVLSVLISAGH